MVRLTDSLDMTLDVYRGRKTTMQQQQHMICIVLMKDTRVVRGFLIDDDHDSVILTKDTVVIQGFQIDGDR